MRFVNEFILVFGDDEDEDGDGDVEGGATSVHVTKHLYGVRLRDLVYMTSIYMK